MTRKRDSTGVLFQGKYKSVHVDNDRHLKYLLSYIHLNPNTAPFTYEYSSLRDYMGETRFQGKLLNKESLPAYFENISDIRRELKEWLAYRHEISRSDLDIFA